MIKMNIEALEEFKKKVPAEIGTLTLRDFLDSGYLLDYGSEGTGKFVPLSNLHVDIK